jgi:hypothetical protein
MRFVRDKSKQKMKRRLADVKKLCTLYTMHDTYFIMYLTCV